MLLQSFVFCPYCYNNPPFRDMRKLSGCNSCTHPTCPYSQQTNGVSSCSMCENGVFVLDPGSAPKWKLCCNRYLKKCLLLYSYLELALIFRCSATLYIALLLNRFSVQFYLIGFIDSYLKFIRNFKFKNIEKKKTVYFKLNSVNISMILQRN